MTYARKPLDDVDGIPVFSERDEYTDNYADISQEHLEHLTAHGTNPFMSEEHMQLLEQGTREVIARYVLQHSKVLDVGVGLGRLLNGTPPFDAYGMDISIGYLEVAKSNGYKVCYSRIEDMPYEKNFFDAVVCTDVLEHVLDLNLCVEKILSVIRPKGHLIIRVPWREDLSPYIGYKYRFVHLRILDGEMLTLMFDRVFNCKVLETKVDRGEVVVVVRKP